MGLYRQMVTIRRFEEQAAKAYTQGKIGGFLHLSIGQEAVAVGTMAALRADDDVVASYREHAHAIARGTPLTAVMAELFGKATGCSKGRGGSMHLFDVARHFWGGYGIVGGHLPLAVGLAFAAHYRGEPRIAACFFGEGAASIGEFHEALSLAALWKLPVLFVCENNFYAMGTSIWRSLSIEDVTAKALAYGIERDRFDADDVLVVHDRVAAAVEKIRGGGGPALIEMRTYRFRGHSMADPAKYRTKEEVDAWKVRDAIPGARKRLAEMGAAETDLAALEEACEVAVAEAVRFAAESPEPPPGEVDAHVYA
ncbi:MAG: pyruvate dehydrogenase (acetyl-transferring) E1 component subunit alpha [Myxococcota bacterium]